MLPLNKFSEFSCFDLYKGYRLWLSLYQFSQTNNNFFSFFMFILLKHYWMTTKNLLWHRNNGKNPFGMFDRVWFLIVYVFIAHPEAKKRNALAMWSATVSWCVILLHMYYRFNTYIYISISASQSESNIAEAAKHVCLMWSHCQNDCYDDWCVSVYVCVCLLDGALFYIKIHSNSDTIQYIRFQWVFFVCFFSSLFLIKSIMIFSDLKGIES